MKLRAHVVAHLGSEPAQGQHAAIQREGGELEEAAPRSGLPACLRRLLSGPTSRASACSVKKHFVRECF